MSESDGEQAARSLALEQAYVHEVYEQCATDGTAQGRHWPRIQQFLEELEPGALVCDIGCGNGRYLGLNRSAFKVGAERCQRFASIARHKENEVLACDNLSLPFRDESFDAVLSIAVVHHFSTTERRVRALKELARVLRIGGRLIISVWAMEQRHRKFESQDVLVPWPKPYCLSSSGSPIKPRASTCSEDRQHRAQSYLLSKGKGSKPRSYWIDPIFSPSPSSSSLSSPNETCYSFFRRALQKLAGGRRSSGAWLLDSWQANGGKQQRSRDEDEGDLDDLPIELRRLEDPASLRLAASANCSAAPPQQHSDSLGVKSRSLGSIVEVQRLELARSSSSIPGLCGEPREPQKQESLQQRQGLSPASSKPRLVKQKSHLLDEACCPEAPENTATEPSLGDIPELQVEPSAEQRLPRRGKVQKQSSMNEELMSIERLKERESVRRNITKQASLNEELIYKSRPTFEAFRDSLYSGSASKRFQLLKSGLSSRIKQSTSNIEKVSGMSIKNGFVRILQSWKSTESPSTTTTTTALLKREGLEPIERRLSREDGSDSSKDSSLQSDTSVDSEDSFASVIYVPKKNSSPLTEAAAAAVLGPPLQPSGPGYQLNTTSAPPSPRLKYAPELATARRHTRLKLMSVSPLLKQFPATSKSLPPPSPPGLSPRSLNQANMRPFFSGNEVAPSSDTTSLPERIAEAKRSFDSQPLPRMPLPRMPPTRPAKPPEDGSALIGLITEPTDEDEESRRNRLDQIKELLLRQKPGFASRAKPAFPLVRRASTASPGRLEKASKVLPRLLSLELFNPETDDLDSDSSGVSSPESVGSVISVISDERYAKSGKEPGANGSQSGESGSPSLKLLEAAANVASSLEEAVGALIQQKQSKPAASPGRKMSTAVTCSQVSSPNVDTRRSALDEHISPVESTWNEECKRHLVDLTDRLSGSLVHEIDQFCRRSRLADESQPSKPSKPSSDRRSSLEQCHARRAPDCGEPDDDSKRRTSGSTDEAEQQHGNSIESSDIGDSIENTISSEASSQPESLRTRRFCTGSTASLASSSLATEQPARVKLAAQARSASEEIPPRHQRHPALAQQHHQQQQQQQQQQHQQQHQQRTAGLSNGTLSNGTLSGSSSQESLPSDQITYHQYYHVFREGELDQLINKYVENLHIISSYYDHASWCIVAEKVQVWTI